MFIRDLKLVKVDTEDSMTKMGFEDECIIYTLDTHKFFQFNLLANTFTPLTLQTLITNNVTNEVIGVTEDQVFADIYSVTNRLKDLIQRILIQLHLNGLELNDEVLLFELDKAFKEINL